MIKLKFKWSFDELNAIAESLRIVINVNGEISVNELLVRTIMLEYLIQLQNKLVWKYHGKKTHSMKLVDALAFKLIFGRISLDKFSPYQAAVILPVLSTIDKEVFRHKHPVAA